MIAARLMGLVAVMVTIADTKRLVFRNNHRDTIWVGSLGNAGKQPVNGGGWEMRPGTEVTLDVNDQWAGRFWARTGCRFDGNGRGHCETGDCGDKLQCNGAGGAPPVTLAEMTFDGDAHNDFYDISNVDGFNVPASMTPLDRHGGGDRYRCQTAACNANINSECPGELQVVAGGRVVGCKSACLAFNTDQYCCRGNHNQPHTCRSSDWPKNYPEFFKRRCPDAYSYAYDDQSSTFKCSNTGYKITFG